MAHASETHATQGGALTKAQWGGFFAAFGGWMLDGFDSSIFGLVLVPTLTELLPRSGYTVDTATIGFFGQLMAAFYLLGWGFSFIIGPIADRYGRMPTLMGSIIIYSIFTALSGFCDNVWQLGACRFMAAFGLGGEWSIAGTFVAETMPERVRARFGGLLHSGAYIGLLLGAVLNYVIGIQLGWRWMFIIGIIPAFFVFYIRSQAVEPERWVKVSTQTRRESYGVFIARILQPPYRARTWGNIALLIVAIVGLYAGAQYVGTSIIDIATREGLPRFEALRLASVGLGLVSLSTAVGCVAAPFLANAFGRRKALAFYFSLMTIGIAGGFGWAFYHSLFAFFCFLPILGFGGADLAMFTIWLPEQYATDVRASAFAFCTTMARFVAAALTFLVGYGISSMHTIGTPLALTAIPFAIGIFLVVLAPETKGKPLPE